MIEAPASEPEVVRLETPGTKGNPRPAATASPAAAAAGFGRTGGSGTVPELDEAAPVFFETTETAWGESDNSGKPTPWGWFALAGVIAAGAVTWSLWKIGNSNEAVESQQQALVERLEADSQRERSAARLVDRIGETLAAYCRASSVEELLPLVRHPERVKPLMQAWYAGRPVPSSPLASIQLLQPTVLEGRMDFWVSKVATEDGATQNLLLEAEMDGDVRVDWETAVCHQPMDWNRFATERPPGTRDFRVYVEADHLYSHEFSDAGKWQSFRLTTLRGEETLFGYARRDSEAARTLLGMIARTPKRRISVVLRLDLPENLQSPRGLVIERVVSPFWILLDDSRGGS